jgi:solute carrier family 12 sodium/potassium/chloride transporter 2
MQKSEKSGYQFGTFKGVFTPSILTILGVIMYLRLGWVIGNVGLIPTLIIVTLSSLITFFTALSISALASNMRVRGGGAYYIISRSLGIEAGAAIGLPLFLAQALGVSFYIVGFAESIVQIVPFVGMTTVSFITLIVLAAVAFKSADLALKTQYFILILIALSLVSFFMGTGGNVMPIAPGTLVPGEEKFWVVFAVFFPAVTGILSGVSMSGDLKKPEKAIPWGTLAAVACSYAIYMAIPIFFVRVVQDHRLFLVDSMLMHKVARWGALILAGLWGATLSSAMGSMLGAPRTLQAISKDGIVFRFLGRGFGKNQEPRIAMLLSFLIALTGILAGDLNVLASVLSMFFLTAYGLLNLSAGFGRLIHSPSWRPKFKVHWGFSFAGAFGCFAAMLMISPGATFIALFVSLVVYALMKRRGLKARWGDMKYGIIMLMVQFGLYKLSSKKPDEKTWRPNILVLSGSPTSRWHLIEIANAISHGYGLLTVASVPPEKHISAQRKESIERTISNYLQERGVKALVKVYPADDLMNGISSLIKGYGFGPVEPNTILLGETEEEKNLVPFVDLIKMIYEHRRNLIIIKESEEPADTKKVRCIDVWWGQKGNNAGLILALAHLLNTSPSWPHSKLILKTIIFSEDDRANTQKGLLKFVDEVRLEAEVEVILGNVSGIFETIRDHSQNADFVFVGLRPPNPEETNEEYGLYFKDIIRKTYGMPPVAYVLSSEAVDFQKIFSSF